MPEHEEISRRFRLQPIHQENDQISTGRLLIHGSWMDDQGLPLPKFGIRIKGRKYAFELVSS
jgi:hypothetical protein